MQLLLVLMDLFTRKLFFRGILLKFARIGRSESMGVYGILGRFVLP